MGSDMNIDKANKMSVMKFNKDSVLKYTPFVLILGFVAFKIQDLFLPYFWDEAWSYVPAIKEMAIKGPSLLPNSISPDLYRGHPLFFYFASSLWVKFFGTTIWVTKLFPLVISLLFLYTVFTFTKKNFNYVTAIITLIVLMIQSVFFAQSTFLLPEVLLALFTLLSLKSFIDKNYVSTIIWLTFALFTKESAIVIWILLAFLRFIEVYNKSEFDIIHKIKKIFLFIIPLTLIFIFFLIQKMIVGWYFFPEHLSYFNIEGIFGRLNGYSSYLFIFMGRNLLTIFGLLAMILLVIRKDKQVREKRRTLIIISLFVVFYLLFSSANFYSPRYLISILPYVIIIWVYFLTTATQKYHKVFAAVIFSVVVLNNLYFTLYKRGGHDHTLGFRDLIAVQSEIITYCKQMEIYNSAIYTHFLMYNNLTNPDLGYLSENKGVFTNVQNNFSEKTEYALISSNELDNNAYELIKKNGLLLKRFEQKGCWSEFYRIKIH